MCNYRQIFKNSTNKTFVSYIFEHTLSFIPLECTQVYKDRKVKMPLECIIELFAHCKGGTS